VSGSKPSEQGAQDARVRVLDSAELLFAGKGFDSVTLRDIASTIGLTHSALYYHFPGGKEELFAEVMERNIRRHGEGLAAGMEAGGRSLRGKLRGAADWLLSQPPMDLIRMAETDLKAISPEAARRLMDLVYVLILRKLQAAIEAARDSGEVGACDPGLLAGGIVGLVESLHSVPVTIVGRDRRAMAAELVDVLLKGIEYKGDSYVGSRIESR
jgi:TetR/AcrR family transcriptional regulator, cholesterol catabolism regulator